MHTYMINFDCDVDRRSEVSWLGVGGGGGEDRIGDEKIVMQTG